MIAVAGRVDGPGRAHRQAVQLAVEDVRQPRAARSRADLLDAAHVDARQVDREPLPGGDRAQPDLPVEFLHPAHVGGPGHDPRHGGGPRLRRPFHRYGLGQRPAQRLHADAGHTEGRLLDRDAAGAAAGARADRVPRAVGQAGDVGPHQVLVGGEDGRPLRVRVDLGEHERHRRAALVDLGEEFQVLLRERGRRLGDEQQRGPAVEHVEDHVHVRLVEPARARRVHEGHPAQQVGRVGHLDAPGRPALRAADQAGQVTGAQFVEAERAGAAVTRQVRRRRRIFAVAERSGRPNRRGGARNPARRPRPTRGNRVIR
jgi:hypothetical protein